MKSNMNVHQHLSKMLASTKIRYSILFCSLATIASGQVAIGKTEVTGNSTLLEFVKSGSYVLVKQSNDASTLYQGIILSAVEEEPVFAVTPGISSPNNGTFVFDRTSKTVKVFENNVWKDLTEVGDASQADANANASDETASSQGVIIGASTSEAIGVLVLESPDKALILPHVYGAFYNLKSPYPGTMVFDVEDDVQSNPEYPRSFKGSIAIFDGVEWNYWTVPHSKLEGEEPGP